MKTIIIQSSPNLEGLTASCAKAVKRGVESAGEETELVNLNKMKIVPCMACEDGWGKCWDEGECTIGDEFSLLRTKMAEADSMVFVTPVYFGDLSESAKTFLDRLRRCESSKEHKSFIGKRAVGITSAGGTGRGAVRALLNLEDYLRRLEFEVFDLVSVTRFSKDHKIKMLEEVGRLLNRK